MAAENSNASEAAFRKAIALEPTMAKAHNNLGALLANQGQWEEAAQAFRTALQHDPENDKARLNLEQLRKLQ